MSSASIFYQPLNKNKVEVKNNFISIKTYEQFLIFECHKCGNENIFLFNGAKKYNCSRCNEEIIVKIVSKTFRGKIEHKRKKL